VKPLDFALLADENIQPDVVAFLRQQGHDIRSLAEEGLLGRSDTDILHTAHQQERVVLTHDSDFGMLAIAQVEPFTGIIYLRPGHIRASFTIQTMETLAEQSLDVSPPFIIVAEQRDGTIRVRTRQL
jgi:predicted nuclease of predicted toxin-antitoxin system